MNSEEKLLVERLDAALIAIGRYADGEVSLKDLEASVSVEVADLLQRLGLAILKISHMPPRSFSPQFLEAPKITTVGQARLARITRGKPDF